jgi:hypothetical protein
MNLKKSKVKNTLEIIGKDCYFELRLTVDKKRIRGFETQIFHQSDIVALNQRADQAVLVAGH